MDNSKKTINYKSDIIALLIIIVAFTISFCLWGQIKSVNFCDEVYSYSLSNSMNEMLTLQLTPNHWYYNGEIKDILSANDGFQFRQVMLNNKGDVHPPIYYFAIHFLSVLNSGSASKWIGLAVNYFTAIISLICVYVLLKQITKSMIPSVIGCLLFISSPAVISMNMFIRMYSMFSMWVILFILIAYNIYNNEKKWWLYVALGITTFCGFLTQYYFSVFCVIFTSCYCICKLIDKHYKNVVAFITSLVAALFAATLFWRTWIRHMFSGYLGGSVTENATDFTKVLNSIAYGFVHLFTLMFNKLNWLIGIAFLVLIVFLIVKKSRHIRFIISLVVTAILYSIAAVHLTPVHLLSYRYFYPVVVIMYMALILSLYFSLQAIDKEVIRKNTHYIFSGLLGIIVVLNFVRPIYDKSSVYFVDLDGKYAKNMELLDSVKDIPWIYYGYENATMTELMYDSTMSSSFIMVNGLNPFDDKEFLEKDCEFILFKALDKYYFGEDPIDNLESWFKGELEFEQLSEKGFMIIYKVTHKMNP